jgi:hypothetical protein
VSRRKTGVRIGGLSPALAHLSFLHSRQGRRRCGREIAPDEASACDRRRGADADRRPPALAAAMRAGIASAPRLSREQALNLRLRLRLRPAWPTPSKTRFAPRRSPALRSNWRPMAATGHSPKEQAEERRLISAQPE